MGLPTPFNGGCELSKCNLFCYLYTRYMLVITFFRFKRFSKDTVLSKLNVATIYMLLNIHLIKKDLPYLFWGWLYILLKRFYISIYIWIIRRMDSSWYRFSKVKWCRIGQFLLSYLCDRFTSATWIYLLIQSPWFKLNILVMLQLITMVAILKIV